MNWIRGCSPYGKPSQWHIEHRHLVGAYHKHMANTVDGFSVGSGYKGTVQHSDNVPSRGAICSKCLKKWMAS